MRNVELKTAGFNSAFIISSPAVAERLERARVRALEEPARADLEAVVPGRESRRVEREARLPRQRAAKGFAPREHGGVLRAEAHRLAQLNEVARVQAAS